MDLQLDRAPIYYIKHFRKKVIIGQKTIHVSKLTTKWDCLIFWIHLEGTALKHMGAQLFHSTPEIHISREASPTVEQPWRKMQLF